MWADLAKEQWSHVCIVVHEGCNNALNAYTSSSERVVGIML